MRAKSVPVRRVPAPNGQPEDPWREPRFFEEIAIIQRLRDLEDRRAYRRALLRTMRSLARRLQVNCVEPSDTDDLEWRDPDDDPDDHPEYEHPPAIFSHEDRFDGVNV
jgi:hypothetical protein